MSTLPIQLPRRRHPILRLLLVLLIFGGGVVCGGAGALIIAAHRMVYFVHHPDEIPARATHLLTRKLDLTEAQSEKVEQIITEHQRNLQAIRREVQPRVRAELESLHTDIDGVLTPDQQVKWNTLYNQAVDDWVPPVPPVPPPPVEPATQP